MQLEVLDDAALACVKMCPAWGCSGGFKSIVAAPPLHVPPDIDVLDKSLTHQHKQMNVR